MKASAITIVSFFIALLAGGCDSTPHKLTPATDPSVQTNFVGFSVQPPEGQDWFVQEEGPNWIKYIKRTEHKEKHTVIAMARSQAVDPGLESTNDLLRHVEKIGKTERSDSRFRVVNQEISSLKIDRAECARIDATAEDHGVPWAFGSTYFLQGSEVVCLHPDSPHMLIRLSYSQRFEKGKTPLVLESEINSFIESITFDSAHRQFSNEPLLGAYASDKFAFFPKGRNAAAEELLLAALEEGSSRPFARTPDGRSTYKALPAHLDPGGSGEQSLASEYDVAWLMVKGFSGQPTDHERLGAVLGKVGRWEEALQIFREGLSTGRHVDRDGIHVIPEPGMRGNVGVAAHVLGRYDESVSAFDKARALDPTYFDTRQIQRKLWEASQSGHFVLER